ncbi:MAG: UDP-3-O-(3-hydroxymyristoyl)glucosamine N-acyltransferase, partial [Chloroflexi bacterium]|nr:UDP-3-O-(3-hydroxymyristoyl)glucosamine N-acyltransferase [Chloroflexota bacterium]
WTGERGIAAAVSTKSAVILCSPELNTDTLATDRQTFIVVARPRLAFVELARAFFVQEDPAVIHPTAVIEADAVVAEDVAIGANAYISSGATIGQGARIGSNVYIGPGVSIGKRVIVHPGASIGADGFSYELTSKREWLKFPQVASVVVGDDVEIGANTCIDRGALADTFVGEGTKLDNLTHIAHNVRIEPHCVIVAEVFIGGSSTIGSYSWIGPQACVRDQIHIGRNVLVGMGSVVTKDVPDNAVVLGSPARVVRENPPLPWEAEQTSANH